MRENMKKPPKKPSADVHVRIPRDVADRIEARAKTADRPFNWQVVHMLRKQLDVSKEDTKT